MNLLVQGVVQILQNAQAGPEDPHMLAQLGDGGRLIRRRIESERRTQAPTPTPSFLAASLAALRMSRPTPRIIHRLSSTMVRPRESAKYDTYMTECMTTVS